MFNVNLINNLALLVSLSFINGLFMRRWKPGTWAHKAVSGLLFGVAAIVGMLTPLHVAPGVFIDGRSIVIGVAGFFGGPVVVAISAAMAVAFRFYLGGGGAIVGAAVIVESALFGVVLHIVRHRHPRLATRHGTLLAFGVLVHVVLLVLQLGLPGGIGRSVISQVAVPVILLYPPATVLVCVLFLDEEKHLKHEDALRQSEERYRDLFEESPIPLWEEDFASVKEKLDALRATGVTDMRGYLRDHPEVVNDLIASICIIDVNKAAVVTNDAETKQQLLSNLPLMTTARSTEAMREEFARIAEGETRIELEIEGRSLKGARRNSYVRLAALPGHEADLKRMLVSVVDLTEYKRLEDHLRQAQKMEAVGRLAGGVAHDFNNLLTVIQGYGQFVLDSMEPDDPVISDQAEVLKAAEAAAGLTRQLLAFSRRQVLETRVLNLNDVLGGMGKMLKRIIGEDIRVEMKLAKNPWRVRADAGQIEQVIVNLAVNARDAMPSGGALTIETENAELDQAFVDSHPGAPMGPRVRLVVRDTGIGMSADVQEHLFEPFFTTKGMGRGTGLGLATVFGIVKQSGGNIYVESALGKGSAFIIYLPPEAEAREGAQERDSSALPRGNETILVVEDDPMVRALTVRSLRSLGYRVVEAENATEVPELYRTASQTIKLVLTDVVMPDMNGRQLGEELWQMAPGVKILFMSGYTDDDILHLDVQEGSVPFLQKPFTLESLARKVRALLDDEGSPAH